MENIRDNGRQFYCQHCGKKLPITVDEVRGVLRARVKCKFCKTWNELHLQDIAESR